MNSPNFPHSHQRGTALLPALIIIGMVTGIIVLFFNLVTIQTRTAASHVASHDLNSLRDTALNSVIGQLRQGTTETNGLWVSQPGALRTYEADSGTASRIYKLYSAKDMVVNAATLASPAQRNLEDDVPDNWNDQPAIYGDMNQPGVDPLTGQLSFPIIDPRVMDNATPSATPGSQTPEGFSYSNRAAVSSNTIYGVLPPSGSPNSQRLPMPVRWVYMLQDGTMGIMEGETNPTFVPFIGGSMATENNPIVGRMAFWTDDESAKININTASEGLYWDTPRVATEQEINFAKQTPVRNEVQRFGGHPATTSLSTVFFPRERLVPGQGNSNEKLEKIYNVAPRVNYKGLNGAYAGIMGNNSSPVAFDQDRLYSSVDEFLLEAPSSNSATEERQVQALFDGDIDRLKRLRFFLTAESRAPETTASGTPRVSLWPVHYDFTRANTRTSFDNVSAFCTTLGSEIGSIQPFHFRRNSARTNEGEFTNDSEFSVAASDDPYQIGTKGNGDLTTYLLQNVKTRAQGYSRSFAEKYDTVYGAPTTRVHNSGTGVVAMMEYIRQTNLHDTSMATGNTPVTPYGGRNDYWIGTEVSGQVTTVHTARYPAAVNGNNVLKRQTNQLITRGVSREYTISEFGLVFSMVGCNTTSGFKFPPTLVNAPGDMPPGKLSLPPGTRLIQVAPVFEAFCPSQGYTMIAPSTSARAAFLDLIRINSPSLGLRRPGGQVLNPFTFAQASGDVPAPQSTDGWLSQRERDLPAWQRWGRMGPNVAHLAYLAGGNPPSNTTARRSSGTWWIGWGGSGGTLIYTDNNSTNDSQTGSRGTDIDLDIVPPNKDPRAYMNQYSRGYFLIHEDDAEFTITFDRGSDTRATQLKGTFEIMIGNQRDGDFAGMRLYAEMPVDGIKVQVPADWLNGTPATPRPTPSPTFGTRLESAYATGSINRYRYTSPFITPQDVVRSWVVRHGDYRLAYMRLQEGTELPENERLFILHPRTSPALRQVHSFTKAGGDWEVTALAPGRDLVPGANYQGKVRPDFPVDPSSSEFSENVPANYPYPVDPNETRDWDNGTGIAPDGAYWNKPDDVAKIGGGNTGPLFLDGGVPPYFQTKNWDGIRPDSVNDTTAPNQLIPSSVMFGSIPSAASTGIQWTTYLFRPDITPGGHLGSEGNSVGGSMTGAPPDHVLLDWFWMPVVQPYAISEPFSTAGKINMNYRIAPFTYIKRATGLHAVLKSERVLAVPSTAGSTYKNYSSASGNGNTNSDGANGWRHYIDADKTLLQWESKFDSGEFFMNAGEVCEQFLVPEGEASTASSGNSVRNAMTDFWEEHRLTGDNSLERPYANIYPRLTTRSNTYRIHYLVQTINKARSASPDTFDPKVDSISGESQGDAVVERSIDPNDPALTTADYNYISKALNNQFSDYRSLDKLYSWRIRQIRRFNR